MSTASAVPSRVRTTRGLCNRPPPEQAARAGERAEGVILDAVGEFRAADRRQPDPEPAEPLVDVIQDLPPVGPDRPERDAEGHRHVGTVLHPVRPGHREVEAIAGVSSNTWALS